MLPTLQTERLLLRPLREDDLDDYATMMGDEEVCRYLGHPPRSREDAWRDIAFLLGHGVLRGWTNNAVVEKTTGRVLGRCGLYRPEGWPGLEVGWALARSAWGRGIATEAATAWRDWAFATLGVDELVSVVHVDNLRSARVAQRIGHRRLRELTIRDHPCVLWGQSRAEWTARRG